MKKNIIALAVAAAFAAPVAMADAPTVYGQLNLNIADIDGQDVTVNSTDSRLGVKGSEDLGDGLKAVYGIEFGLAGVADGSTVLTNRNQFLGLAGGFGTVLMGRHDTPTKMTQVTDLFPDGAADIKNLTNGLDSAEIRASDVLAYVSPSFGGVKVIGAYVADEDETNNWTNVAVTYGSTKEGLYLAAAYQEADMDVTYIRVGAQYVVDGLTASVMHQDNSGDDTDEGSFTQFQAGYKMGKFFPKIKYVMTDRDTVNPLTGNDDGDSLAIGLNYSLGKKTTAYIYGVDREDVGAADANVIVGMVHKF